MQSVRRFVLLLVVALELASAASVLPRLNCDPSKCSLPNCRCSSTDIPGLLAPQKAPQFVVFTFDDGVTVSNIDFYRKAFNGRKNPDECPISATFFVSHEYTNYQLVHELYSRGHEIALHSVTHSTNTSYWREASVDQLVEEFAGEKILVSKFANIPQEDIQGIRLPFLQMSGERSFEMMARAGLVYDYSWPTIHYRIPGMWPYSLDYRSKQDCVIGPCPEESYPNTWVMPMISWTDQKDVFCSMVDTCVNIPDTVEGLAQFMIDNFKTHYYSNRSPFGFYVHAAWFISKANAFEAYLQFIDYLNQLEDVFIVSATEVLDWVRHPRPVSEMIDEPNCNPPEDRSCTPRSCVLKKGDEERWMTTCSDVCPRVYPWLGNPLGE